MKKNVLFSVFTFVALGGTTSHVYAIRPNLDIPYSVLTGAVSGGMSLLFNPAIFNSPMLSKELDLFIPGLITVITSELAYHHSAKENKKMARITSIASATLIATIFTALFSKKNVLQNALVIALSTGFVPGVCALADYVREAKQ